ncbi:response regulator [candidate division KSB1 bacterium]|nr:response regulator [candidate division KSB1 bacterium]NIR72722.1 response regulator [candidate division KSB1 bacterium]NIS26807.1 response regulator [candidate division KSB1 bacterium]NIT73601.1 response regulator [candidate division KSB1 bacterium]NIU27477.1 response regulator [candidate division KSB1 bacterium]
MRKYMRSYLQEHYQIIEAVGGVEGVERAVAEVPDLIVSDVMMPKLDGFAMCEKLKSDQRTSHIPVILLPDVVGRMPGRRPAMGCHRLHPQRLRQQ